MAFPKYYHKLSGKHAWVKIHAEDSLLGLPAAYITNPEKFKPQVNPFTQKYETWGIDDQENEAVDNVEIPLFLQRSTRFQILYDGVDDPQTQFISHLISIKEKKLALRGTADRAERDYVLHMVMPKIIDEDGSEFIWRRMRVPGAMTLHDLEDNVLRPAMGWIRGYHGYTLTDRTDGAVFGPEDAYSIDMGNMCLNGHIFMPDHKYTVADILEHEGSSMQYLYDLGDQWAHDITVEKILPVSESNGRAELIGGEGACPPEDTQGNCNWSSKLAVLRVKPGHKPIMDEIYRSPNYRHKIVRNPKWRYSPHEFDLEAARRSVAEAVEPRGRTRTRAGSAGTKQSQGEEPAVVPLCSNCDYAFKLRKCAGCHEVWYCSKQCRRSCWQQHKPKCGGASPDHGQD